MITFKNVTTADRATIQHYTLNSDRMNCDLSFANIITWRFLYDTQWAEVDGFLVFRFWADHHLAYMAPVADGPWTDATLTAFARVVRTMRDDAIAMGHPFLMLGVSERMRDRLETAFPGAFRYREERDFADYIYLRERLATLAGKKLQGKRNHCNKFRKLYPNYEYRPLTKEMIGECLRLEETWRENREEDSTTDAAERHENDERTEEQRSMVRAFSYWDDIDAHGGTIWVDGRLVAFTFGCPINHETFDVCVEKADLSYEGAFSIINQEFARHLPEQYVYVNREEDLGIEGLRRAKLSYKPDILLMKHSVMEQEPLAAFADPDRIKAETMQLWRDTFHDAEAFVQLYFNKVYRPMYNLTTQQDQHVVAALQTLPYRLLLGGEEVKVAYISGVSVAEQMRRHHIGSSLMQQAHHRLYEHNMIFALLIPAEPWLYKWYQRLGYEQLATCIPLPEDILTMTYPAYDAWQRAQDGIVLHTREELAVVQEDIRLAGDAYRPQTEGIPAMVRVINAERALALYAERHPTETANFLIRKDDAIPMNNIYLRMEHGTVTHTDEPLEGARELTINELATFILGDRPLMMTGMLN